MKDFKTRFVIAILLTLTLAQVLYCESEPPKLFPKGMKTESEFKATENQFKEKVRWIQENPNSSNVMIQLKDLYSWVGAAPYVKAAHNTQYIPGFMENKKQYFKFDVLFWEYTYAQVACSFAAPTNDKKFECIEDGIKSLIACYRNICAKNDNAKWDLMESYVKKIDTIGIPRFLKMIDDSITNAKASKTSFSRCKLLNHA